MDDEYIVNLHKEIQFDLFNWQKVVYLGEILHQSRTRMNNGDFDNWIETKLFISPKYANYHAVGSSVTSAVGCFSIGKSPFGVMDMSGNIWEWSRTVFVENYHDYPPQNDYLDSDRERVIRGGSFHDPAIYIRSTTRNWSEPNNKIRDLGFRIVLISNS